MHSDSTYTPVVTADGTGGAIVVYEDVRGSNLRDFYAQKMSPEGKSLWGKKGVLLGSGYKYSAAFSDLKIVGDAAGGAIIAWWACPTKEMMTSVNYITRVDSKGSILWQREGSTVSQMISDGAGGVIVASISEDQQLSILKVDSKGNYLWGEEGLPVYFGKYAHSLHMAGDGSGGAIIVQQSLTQTETNFEVFVQKVSSDGSLPWGQKGILMYPGGGNAEEVEIVNDGSGGAIVAWQMNLEKDMRVQRVDASGNVLWQQNGVPLEITKAAENAFPHSPLPVSDGSGGAIIIWEDSRHGLASIFAQRVGSDGTMEWQPGGVQVCYIRSNASLFFRQIVSDGVGGAIVSCRFKEAGTSKKGVLVQSLDSTGKTVWPANGIMVTGSETTCHFISPDEQGGVLVVWGIGRSEKSYVQRIDAQGKLSWGAEGIRLNP
jgi:predicted transcriptional regulator